MDQQAVMTQFAQTTGNGNGFMGDRPHFLRPLGKVHGETAGWIERGRTIVMKQFDNLAGHGVCLFKGLQELQIGYIAGHATDIFRVEFADNAQEAFGARENLQNILPVFCYVRAIDLDQSHIVCSGFKGDGFQPCGVEGGSGCRWGDGCLLFPVILDRGVFFQLHISTSGLITGSSQLRWHRRSRFSPGSARGQTRLPAA